jgi:hypothetical protein
MFLPVLLVRDYGIWAWVVFAVPNVIGAAAMGWVLPDAEASRKMVEEHRTACRWFSIVTLAFHFYFLGWILIGMFEIQMSWRLALLGLALFPITGSAVRSNRAAPSLAILISLCAAAGLLVAGRIPRLPPHVIPTLNLIWVALPCVLGFSLCPYLDLTFHRARQSTQPAEGRAAFAIGFGVVFLSMITFTLAYTGWLADTATLIPVSVAIILGAHLIGQVCLKVGLHSSAIRAAARWTVVDFIVLLLGPLAALLAVHMSSGYHGLSLFELLYRLFMAFYGLVFPAYAWICMFHKGRRSVWLATVAIAAPMYWMGFIERQMIWLLPGVALVVLAGITQPKMSVRNQT